MHEKIIDHYLSDYDEIVNHLINATPNAKNIWYQKHMAIHMLPEVSLAWMGKVRNCFLIRDPAEVITSMAEFRGLAQDPEEGARLAGIPQLERIFDEAWALEGRAPLVIDANDLLADPPGVLSRFCAAVGMPFNPDQPITWAPGKHEGDGAWADAWYQKVYQTTGLEPYLRKETVVPKALEPVVARCRPTYERIAAHRL